VLVAPIPCSNDAFALRGGEEEPVALLLTSDPEAAPATAERAVARVLGLTPTESRVTAALARGATLREYADEAGVSIGTARWTLKCVLQKTGARRQSQLVALVLRSIASLAVPDDLEAIS
jgi:DNA-binding CsgD family transcriptional regulator